MQPKPYVLVVEDSHSVGLLYEAYLKTEKINMKLVETGAEAFAAIDQHIPQAILLDLHLPDMNGMDILTRVVKNKLNTTVVMVTGHGSVDVAVDAIRAGAFDFIEKPFSLERLVFTLRNALERQRLSTLVDSYQYADRDHYHDFIGASPAMRKMYHIIDTAAPSNATLFITGESGTGKELCAEAIHAQSSRVDKNLVALNCAAIPKDLMESEIFGHIKGAFTGAHTNREGAASHANGGTLFLDEVCEMDLDLQSKLLRFIQTGTFQKVGSNVVEKVDIRFICATNRNPEEEVAAGRFREDLYYRLLVIPIAMPALRQRAADVMLIAHHLLKKYSKEENKAFQNFDETCEAIFLAYNWPGNVRQLQNVLRNIIVLHNGELVTQDMLPPPLSGFSLREQSQKIQQYGQQEQKKIEAGADDCTRVLVSNGVADSIRPLANIEKEVIEHAINLCSGNIPKAAIHLGISASTIYRKKQSWRDEASACIQ